jgi:hypothetical protein
MLKERTEKMAVNGRDLAAGIDHNARHSLGLANPESPGSRRNRYNCASLTCCSDELPS